MKNANSEISRINKIINENEKKLKNLKIELDKRDKIIDDKNNEIKALKKEYTQGLGGLMIGNFELGNVKKVCQLPVVHSSFYFFHLIIYFFPLWR